MKKSKYKVFWIISILLFCFVIVFIAINYKFKKVTVSTENNIENTVSQNQQYKAIHNDETNSLQIINLSNNKVVYELKDNINPKLEADDPHSGNNSYFPDEWSPDKWSPDGKSLLYSESFYEGYSLGVISQINNQFTNLVIRLNQSPDYTNCSVGIWSPDSKKLVTVGENRNPCVSDIYIIDSNKGITVKSINSNNFLNNSSSFDSIEDAIWSNDSKTVTLTKNTLNQYDQSVLKTEKIIIQVE